VSEQTPESKMLAPFSKPRGKGTHFIHLANRWVNGTQLEDFNEVENI